MTRRFSLALMVLASACARAPAPDAVASSSSSTVPSTTPAPPSALSADAPAPTASALPSSSAAVGPAPEAPLEGLDFVDEARALFRVAACGPSGDVPSGFDAAVVGRHCSELQHAYDEYKKSWVDVAKPFLAALRPKDLPSTVVYPFGGGDSGHRPGDLPRRDRDHDHFARARRRRSPHRPPRTRAPRARAGGASFAPGTSVREGAFADGQPRKGIPDGSARRDRVRPGGAGRPR